MRRINLLPLLAVAAPLVASAQPDARDHRPPPPRVRDHRSAAIHKIEPASGAVGSTITLHGELPGEHHHREWRLDRPVISSVWPPAGRPGTHVVVRGRNLPPDAQVRWNGTLVPGIAVEAAGNAIGFEIPKGATTGMLTLHTSHGRDLSIGEIRVAAGVDLAADFKRIEDERRRRAEAAWAEHEKAIAKDESARRDRFAKWQAEQEATREQRRERELAELRATWKRELLDNEEFQAEMTLHGQRMADLERMRKLAEQMADKKVGVRVELLVARENDRHDQRVSTLIATSQAK